MQKHEAVKENTKSVLLLDFSSDFYCNGVFVYFAIPLPQKEYEPLLANALLSRRPDDDDMKPR